MIAPFTYDVLPGRVVFGPGASSRVGEEVARTGGSRALVVASSHEDHLVRRVQGSLGDRFAGRFSDVVQHVPLEQAEQARSYARELDADVIVTIGGGSATGFGKAIALDIPISIIAIPTTYAGSEMTAIWGLSTDGEKTTGTDPRVKPVTVIYDPELTATLPPSVSGPSGMNALAHCVEALYGPGTNPVIQAIALEGARVLHGALPVVTSSPDDLGGRSDALYGAYLAGVALGTGGTGLHHKTAHVLGGMFGLDHGQMNAVLLGHVVAYNAAAMGPMLGRLADALETDDPAGTLFDLSTKIGAPTSLAAIGMPAEGIAEAARRASELAGSNIRPPTPASVAELLDDAYHGRRPRSSPTSDIDKGETSNA